MSEKLMKRMNDPNNLKWAEDKSRFGYKMLLKMGWSEGKGLGANEDGLTTHVKVDKRQDNRGIGAEQKTEAWVNTSREFEDALKSFSSIAEEINKRTKEIEEQNQQGTKKKSKKRYSSSSSSSDSAEDSSSNDSNSDSSDSDSESDSGSSSDSDSSSSSSKSKKSSSSSSSESESEESDPSKRKRFVPRHFIPNRVLRSKSPTTRYSSEHLKQIFAEKQAPIVVPDKIPEKYKKPVVEDNCGVMTVHSSASMEEYFKQKLKAQGKDVTVNGKVKGIKRKRETDASNKKSKKAKN